MSNCFNPANILLPKENTDMEKWSVIACDQFTSQADYWNAVEKYVGDAPSTLNVVFPEIYLGNEKNDKKCACENSSCADEHATAYAAMSDSERISCINSTMEKYLSDGTLRQAVTDGYVLVERTTESGVRLGIVGLVDLEDYDFDPKNPTLIRATEGTVISRIPPRVKIREHAAIELPHVMLLVDDPVDEANDPSYNGKITGVCNSENSVQESVDNIGNVEHGIIEYIYALKDSFRKLYDTDLMQNGGHIRGYAIEGEAAKQVTEAFAKKQEQCGGFLFAVGDGNHSLATAKTCWENIKKSGKYTDEQLKTHPARYALVEICNLHSKALEFKPIHRLLTNVDVDDMLAFFNEQVKEQGLESAEGNEIVFEYVDPNNDIDENTYAINITNRGDRLPVEILQGILDKYLELHEETGIDYIHGNDALHGLVKETKGCGIFLQSIDKSTLFPAINAGGVLPRKTFSIGEANEKRYYMECHSISQNKCY
ncbi:DUF1015 domain-containing protein [Agathobacter sp.]